MRIPDKRLENSPSGIQNAVGWSMISIVMILAVIWSALAFDTPETTIQVGRDWHPWGCGGGLVLPVELRITTDGSYILDDQYVSAKYLEAEIRAASSKRRAAWAPLLLRPTANGPSGALVKAISIGQKLGMEVLVGVPLSENEISVANATDQPCETKQSS
jgi:hypothetical protein